MQFGLPEPPSGHISSFKSAFFIIRPHIGRLHHNEGYDLRNPATRKHTNPEIQHGELGTAADIIYSVSLGAGFYISVLEVDEHDMVTKWRSKWSSELIFGAFCIVF